MRSQPGVAIVTGPAQGHGQVLARALARRGQRTVFVGGNGTSEHVLCRVDATSAGGPPETWRTGDFDPALHGDVEGLWRAADGIGPVTAWIHEVTGWAGPHDRAAPHRAPSRARTGPTPFADLDPDDYEATIWAELLASMHVAQVALKGFVPHRTGALWFLRTDPGGQGSGLRPDRLISDAAVRSLVDTLCRDVVRSGVVIGTLHWVGGRQAVRPGLGIDGDQDRSGDESAQAAWLARRLLRTRRNGATLRWPTPTGRTLRQGPPRTGPRRPTPSAVPRTLPGLGSPLSARFGVPRPRTAP